MTGFVSTYRVISTKFPTFGPSLQASRAQILKKAHETIQTGNSEIKELNQEIEKIEELNKELRKQLERSTANTESGGIGSDDATNSTAQNNQQISFPQKQHKQQNQPK
jgi:predicted RNase H-like nuclease (RuvC/YqgF family)